MTRLGALRQIIRAIDSFFGHAVLIMLGFLYVPKKEMNFRSTSDDMTLTLSKDKKSRIHSGDVIICNCQSPIDVIYLCALYSPTFTTIDPQTKQVRPCSRWYLMMNITEPGIAEPDRNMTIDKIVKISNSPIVIFPEGTTSNGRGLLQFVSDLGKLSTNQRFHLMGLKYFLSDNGFMPSLPIGGVKEFFNFICLTCSQWYNNMQVKWISADSIYSSTRIPTPQCKDFNDKIRNVMSVLLHCRTLSLSLKEKEDFLKAYKGIN